MENIVSIMIMIAGSVWIGLLLVAFLGKAIVSLLPAFNRRRKNWSAKAIEADAVVLNMQQIGGQHKRLKLKIQLQVQPVKGRNFVVEIQEDIAEENKLLLKAGNKVRVKYNPDNNNELFLLETI